MKILQQKSLVTMVRWFGSINKGSDFIVDCVNLLHYKCYKINMNCGGAKNNWIKNKKEAVSPINDDNKGFQYTAKIALNHEEIGKKLQRISKIKPFINEYD